MALPTNKKKTDILNPNAKKSTAKNSKFIATSSKSAAAAKKVRSTGANRGS